MRTLPVAVLAEPVFSKAILSEKRLVSLQRKKNCFFSKVNHPTSDLTKLTCAKRALRAQFIKETYDESEPRRFKDLHWLRWQLTRSHCTFLIATMLDFHMAGISLLMQASFTKLVIGLEPVSALQPGNLLKGSAMQSEVSGMQVKSPGRSRPLTLSHYLGPTRYVSLFIFLKF